MTKQNEFKLGDIVEVVGNVWDNDTIKIGMKARVADFKCQEKNVGLSFFENIDGHTLCGQAERGYGWYVEKSVLKVVNDSVSNEPEKIYVVLEGNKTTVTLEDGSTGTANLMHGDTYSVEKGIEIAKAKALISRKTKERDELVQKGIELISQLEEITMNHKATVEPIPAINQEIADLEEKIKVIGG